MDIESAKSLLHDNKMMCEASTISREGNRGAINRIDNSQLLKFRSSVESVIDRYRRRDRFRVERSDSSIKLFFDTTISSYLLVSFEVERGKSYFTLPIFRLNKEIRENEKTFRLVYRMIYTGDFPDEDIISTVINASYSAIARFEKL